MLQMGEDGSTDQMAKDRPSGIVGRAVVRATLPGASHWAPRWCQEGDEVLEEAGMVGAIRAGLEEVETQAITWDKVKLAAEGDHTSQGLIQVI